MGFASFAKKSKEQLARHIRGAAKDSSKVKVTDHAKGRMRLRRVTILEIYECLRQGSILRVPEENHEKGSLECWMERYVSGRQLTTVVALSDENPNLIVVTVFELE